MDESFKVVEDDKVPRNEVHAYINGKKVGVITNIRYDEEGSSLKIETMTFTGELTQPDIFTLGPMKFVGGITPPELLKVDCTPANGICKVLGPTPEEIIKLREMVNARIEAGVSCQFQALYPIEYIDVTVEIGGKDEDGNLPNKA